jgi:hypothetical protein
LLRIVVINHIDGVGCSLNDGITWLRDESDTRFGSQLIIWSKRSVVGSQEQTSQRAPGDTATVGRLFLLDLSDNRVVSLNPDGSDRKVIVTGCRYPDGIAVDIAAGHVYWTNMGHPAANDGFIERADLDRENRNTSVPRAELSLPSRSNSKRRAESCIRATARACA